MKKDYLVTFYLENGSDYRIEFKNITKEELIKCMNNAGFIGNESSANFVNLNKVNCFDIDEVKKHYKDDVESEKK